MPTQFPHEPRYYKIRGRQNTLWCLADGEVWPCPTFELKRRPVRHRHYDDQNPCPACIVAEHEVAENRAERAKAAERSGV
jgi:hypothetical protein